MLFLAAFAVFSVFAQSLLGSAQLDRWLQTTDNTDSTTDLTTVTYIDGVYRRDDPCPQGWIPVLTWCYRALPISTTRSWSASMTACQSLAMNAVLAPVGAPWESEAIRAVSGIMPGQRLWHGCAVDSSPANPSFGDVMLTDASSSKWTQWGGSAYSPSAWAPGSTCFMDSSGLWGLSPGGAVDGSNAYGAVCAMRAFSKDPANSACTAGWRYVRNQAANQANTPSYCYTYFPELRDFATAKAACSEVGADVAGVLDAVQNNKLLKLAQHPLVTRPATTWSGVLREPISPGGSTCQWENANAGSAATYFNWATPDTSGSTCSDLGSVMQDDGEWVPEASAAAQHATLCQYRVNPDELTQFKENPLGFTAFLSPLFASAAVAAVKAQAPFPLPVCGIAFSQFGATMVFMVLSSTDGTGWAPGWTVTLQGGLSFVNNPPAKMRLDEGYHSQQFVCVMVNSGTCPYIEVTGGTPGTGGNIVVDVFYVDDNATPGQLVGHGRGENARANVVVPNGGSCPSASAAPTPPVGVSPSNTPPAVPSASSTQSAPASPSSAATVTPSVTGTASVTSPPSQTSSVTPSVTGTPTGTPTPSSTYVPPSQTPTSTATPSGSGTPDVTPSNSPSTSATPSSSASVSGTPSSSATASGTPSGTATVSGTPSSSATVSGTVSGTPSSSASVSGTASSSVSPTVSSTGTPSVSSAATGTPTAASTPSSSSSNTPPPSSTPPPSTTPAASPTGSTTAAPSTSGAPSGSSAATPAGTSAATPAVTPSVSPTKSAQASPSAAGTPAVSSSMAPRPVSSPSGSPSPTADAAAGGGSGGGNGQGGTGSASTSDDIFANEEAAMATEQRSGNTGVIVAIIIVIGIVAAVGLVYYYRGRHSGNEAKPEEAKRLKNVSHAASFEGVETGRTQVHRMPVPPTGGGATSKWHSATLLFYKLGPWAP